MVRSKKNNNKKAEIQCDFVFGKCMGRSKERHLGVICPNFGFEPGNQRTVHPHAVELFIGHAREVRNLERSDQRAVATSG